MLADGTNTYLYGNGRIAQYTGTTPAYFLGDALGSVRQLANASGAVTLARSYQPFGNTLSSVGSRTTVFEFTGEMRDATGLTYLRARYLSQVGRFITRDAWPGDWRRPMSFNAWLYAYANPVNVVDPTGRYGRDIHYEVTLRLARQVGRSYCNNPQACVSADVAAQLIAKGNFRMDDDKGRLHAGYRADLHFADQPEARRNAQAAISLSEPFLMGAALHQVQDWYSHWNEGYRWWSGGHLEHSLRAGCWIGRPCQRDPVLVKYFHEEAFPDAKTELAERYPNINLQNISDDKLIDLYLYTFFEPDALGTVKRNLYGYDTDYFFGFTDRDREMLRKTDFWVRTFFIALDPCEAASLAIGYVRPSDTEIINFLNSGTFQPDAPPPDFPELAP